MLINFCGCLAYFTQLSASISACEKQEFGYGRVYGRSWICFFLYVYIYICTFFQEKKMTCTYFSPLPRTLKHSDRKSILVIKS